MPFIQKKLDRSINQSRGIFDKYLYRTDDLIVEVESTGYFIESRFSEDWAGSLVECQCSDGYIFGTMGEDGTITTLFNSNSGGSGMPIAPSDGDYYVADGSSWLIAGDVLKADREVVVRGSDFTNQNPIGTDNTLQVTFGAGSGVVTDPVYITSSGEIIVTEANNYHFRVSVSYGRTGSGGTSWVWLRFLVNGVQSGVSTLAKIDNANADDPYQAELTAELPAGVTITVEVWRGSEGNDSGGLVSETPALVGANPVPSADVIVSRYTIKNK